MKTLLQIAAKGIFMLLLALVSVSEAKAQTGINTKTPDGSAALDITSTTKGLLIPRLTTAQRNTMPSPATGLMIYDTDLNCIMVNNGLPNAALWDCTILINRKFFYMPSINIETSPALVGQTLTKNLYGQYASEFGSPKLASTGAPGSIPYFAVATDLNYYITYYDPNIIQIISIDASGLLTYKLIKTANFDSYINIVFMPK